MNHRAAFDAIHEIELLKKDCLGILWEMRQFCPPDQQGNHPDVYRLIATPMLYSVWERCFTLNHAIALRLIREVTPSSGALKATQRAAWLQKSNFYKAFSENFQLRMANEGVDKKLGKGHFAALGSFLESLDKWGAERLDNGIDTENLVMTFSNVNPEVVELNAKAIGIDAYDLFENITLGRLHDLVGRRNEIGHGSMVNPPKNAEFNDLWSFTESLIGEYCDVFIGWIGKSYLAPRKVGRKRGVSTKRVCAD